MNFGRSKMIKIQEHLANELCIDSLQGILTVCFISVPTSKANIVKALHSRLQR